MVRYFDSVSLPLDRSVSGPLHSIQVAENGCIFYSDELNHSVVCLNDKRKLLWHKSGKGSKRGQFNYPRGICLGRINAKGQSVQCLAIADSWNRRIQFFSLNGEFLLEWKAALNIAFSEPEDVRYLTAPLADAKNEGGCWLVLDKGDHALYVIDCDGKPLRRYGRDVNPTVVARWQAAGGYPDLSKLDFTPVSGAPLFDFIYFPTRILGNEPQSLYIWEPYRQHLKLIAYGNFIPLWIGSFEDRVWVAADNRCLIEWSSKAGSVKAYACNGEVFHSDSIDGQPIPSNLPSNELWIQIENSIRRAEILPPSLLPKATANPMQSMLRRAAEHNLEGLSIHSVSCLMAPIHHVTDSLVALADDVLLIVQRGAALPTDLAQWNSRLRDLTSEWSKAREMLYAELRRFSFGILLLRLSSGHILEDAALRPSHDLDVWREMNSGVSRRFIDVVERYDGLTVCSFEVIKNSEIANVLELRSFIKMLCGALNQVIIWLHGWTSSYQTFKLPAGVECESQLALSSNPFPNSATTPDASGT